jgi:eukaryotic-like serine/threonine-protein kinase
MGGDLMAREWDVSGYTEVKTLGSGGFGDVVLARHDGSGAEVAIKYLRRQLLADAGFAELFRAEAAVLASLDDPNVVRLYEYVESPSGAAIVMELVDGVSLRDILARQGATTAEAALVVLQGSLLGLAAAHQRGVVHRDYKPENVLINGDGASKLTDFGIAARAGDSPIPAGTLVYAPPEQFSGSPATPASDVYAATATFYECLTGRPPFTGDTAERLLYQHLSQPVPLEPVPEPLRPLVAAGLAKDPGDRPADGTALVAELRTVAGAAYGPDWEDRGRSGLAAAALLLAALWPSGGPAAVQGSTVHGVRLRRRIPHGHVSAVKAAVMAGIVIAAAVAVAVILTGHTGHTAPPPAPARAAAPAATVSRGNLTGVTCSAANACMAVGTVLTAPPVLKGLTLAESWNGTAWTRKTIPNPIGATNSDLFAVSCSAASTCVAVGSYDDAANPQGTPLAEVWNGTAWTVQTLPNPPGGTNAGLYGVSCTSAQACLAVGNVITNGGNNAFSELWNGTTWTIETTPLPTGTTYSLLNDVSCGSATFCTAVGDYQANSAVSRTLTEAWNGTTWAIEATPNSQGAAGGILSGVSCNAANACMAVGGSDGMTLAEAWNGTTWTIQATPNPQGATGSRLSRVWCNAANACMAIGGSGSNGIFSQVWNGTAWTITAVPHPRGAAFTTLNGVSCGAKDACVAVGNDFNSAQAESTVTAAWNGTAWPVGQLSPATAPTSSLAPTVASPAPTSATAPPPTQVNIQGVTIGISAVNTDPAAMDVAATLAAYFGGIDARNYMQAWDTYTSALQAVVSFQKFSSELSTSQDTQIVVQSIQHDSPGDLDVQVGFQSHQGGQYGPDPGETCTNWSLDYHLVASPGAQPSATASPSYLISKVTDAGAGHTSC